MIVILSFKVTYRFITILQDTFIASFLIRSVLHLSSSFMTRFEFYILAVKYVRWMEMEGTLISVFNYLSKFKMVRKMYVWSTRIILQRTFTTGQVNTNRANFKEHHNCVKMQRRLNSILSLYNLYNITNYIASTT